VTRNCGMGWVFQANGHKKAPAPEATGAENVGLFTQAEQGTDEDADRRDGSQST
jgi:hypothetical protein